jgi:deoxyuridine 5'-triphosphate nucleotidohydrolase
MDRLKIKFKFSDSRQKRPPAYATDGSAGADLTACIDAPLTIPPGQGALVSTGIAVQIGDTSLAGLLFVRSGLSVKYGIGLSNGVGVIDSDYTGEIKVSLFNFSKAPYTIQPFDRIAQLVFTPVTLASFVLENELKETVRGEGGFGSTGR